MGGAFAFAESAEPSSVAADDDEQGLVQREQVKPIYTIKDIKTAPADPRFPNTNQTKHCYTRYVEFHKCMKEKGEGAPECDKFQRWYRSLCPSEWVERWDEQREQGVFAGPY